ncbi:MAG TPA: hypothetical protein VFN74_02490 [Chloroflexota bacterium]|nr:hypothetical protein [Chloroflexota bacterium]
MPKKGKRSAKTVQEPRPSYKGVSKRLRAVLSERECTIPEMMAELDVTEEAVLDALRRLGKSEKGTLRSGIVLSRPCWWWIPNPHA